MRKKFSKILISSLLLSLCLVSTGCSNTTKKTTEISTNSDESVNTHDASESETPKRSRDDLEGMSLESTGLSVSYNDIDLIFPFDASILTSDWSLSKERTYSDDVNASRDFSDAAIYTSEDFGADSELVLATYKFSGESGVAGSQKALEEYGAYSMSLYYGGAEGTKKPNLKLCGIDIFNTDATTVINELTSSSSSIDSASYSIDSSTTYSYVYDLGQYLVELKIVCCDNVVKQCGFTTTVSTVNNN